MKVEVINKGKHQLPAYQSMHAAAMDVRANLAAEVTIAPGERDMIPTGLFCAIPEGYEMQIRPRSGLAAKHGVTLVNAPGTIDADYRGEIKIIVINHGKVPFVVEDGMRIAQMMLAPVTYIEWMPVEALDSTERGAGGFGHTGV